MKEPITAIARKSNLKSIAKDNKKESQFQSQLIGTAAWTIPKDSLEQFPAEGSHLERYSAMLNAVEINSSFYRDHQPKTYSRWAETVPDQFFTSVRECFAGPLAFEPRHPSWDSMKALRLLKEF